MDPQTPTSKQEFRKLLTDAVLFRIEQDLEDVLAMLPDDVPIRDGIRNEVIEHSKSVMSACTLAELTSGAMERHIIDSAIWAQHLVLLHLSQREND